jgi:hypothetical protein
MSLQRFRGIVSGSFESPHMPCSECGASVARASHAEHVCDPERLLDYRVFQLSGEIAAFDAQLLAYLDSPHGRFAAFLAARRRS